MKIAVTGTPGTGKTTVSKLLSKRLGIPHYEISRVVKEKGLYSEYDSHRESFIVDIEKLKNFFSRIESFIADGLVSHYLPVDIVVILRTEPNLLRKRLQERGYSAEKVEENVEAERLAVIASEALSSPGARIIHIDTSRRRPEEVVDLIIKGLKGEEVFDDVDWLENEGAGS
ncbi:MAG: adenylate kinase family protein [Desulfurobacteriaceae bacterium]